MKPESTTTQSQLSFRKATLEEAGFIARLVNSAYRGDSSKAGWTSEVDLLDGQRTDSSEVENLIQDAANSMILLCLQADEVIGSVLLQKSLESAYLGMFVIRPDLQGNGIGKQFLSAAERIAHQEWGVLKITMSVITLRPELIAFYERRGYRRTGEVLPFPDDPAAGIPKVPDLQFEMLEKDL
jgi:ribosomal protein S18 acetylase RimI-like enzyme